MSRVTIFFKQDGACTAEFVRYEQNGVVVRNIKKISADDLLRSTIHNLHLKIELENKEVWISNDCINWILFD